ncbi:serine-rich adhesin for platelets-like isoform X11 [Eriocheir sinensis]|uniref:serine-rich adhesin for platelets-like isoform X11 n=1 Tax=Eriocheir sinensis TaxID=95602 RepID=UPI0021CAC8AD|nr:serine-rich adhesin for platelets-like isoform X11 [Eriocheir sinensis]
MDHPSKTLQEKNLEEITAALLDEKYLVNGFGVASSQWEAGKLAKVYQRLLSVHSDIFDFEDEAAPLSRHLAHVCKCLRLLGIGYLAPKLQDLTDKSRALRIISALDDKISAKYKSHMAARRVRMVMKKEDQKSRLKPRPATAQEETVVPERVKASHPDTPDSQKYMIPSGRQLQRTPVGQEKHKPSQPAICGYESLTCITSNSEADTAIPSIDKRATSTSSNEESTDGSPASPSMAKSLRPPSLTRNNENQYAITSQDRTQAPITINSGIVAPITSNNDRVAPITSNNDRVAPITSNNDKVSPATSNNDKVSPATSNNDKVSPATSNNDKVSPATSNNDKVSPATSNNDKVSPATSNNDKVSPATSNNDRVSPATSNNDKVSPATSNNDKVSPATSNNDRVSPATSNNDKVSPATSNNDRVSPATSNNDRVSPTTSNNDRVSPTTSNNDKVSPATSNNDKVSPATSNNDRVSPATSNNDKVSPATSNNDRVSPATSNNDRVSPATSNNDRVSPATSNNDRVSPAASNNDRVSPTTSNNDRVSPATSNNDRVSPTTSNNDRVSPTTSNNDRVSPTTSNNDRVSPATSNNDRVSPATSNNDRVSPTTSNNDRVSPTTSNNDRVSPTTSNNDRVSPTTSNNDRVIPATSNNDRVSPATSNNDRVSPTTSNNDRVIPATSNNDRVSPATSNNKVCPATSFGTTKSDSPSFTTSSSDDSPAFTISSNARSLITNNESFSTISNNESFGTTNSDSPSFTISNHESLILRSNRSSLTTSCNESLECGGSSDSAYLMLAKEQCTRMGMDLTLQKDSEITYVIATDDKHTGYNSHKKANVTFQRENDKTYYVPTEDKLSGYNSDKEANMTPSKNVDVTYAVPTTDKHCGYSSHEETTVKSRPDVDATYVVPTNKPFNVSNFGMENDEFLLNDTVIKMADDTFVLGKIPNESLLYANDHDDSLQIFPNKRKANQKAGPHSEAKEKRECTLDVKSAVLAKILKESDRNEERQVDAELQAEVFGTSVEGDTCGTTEESLNSTVHEEENCKKMIIEEFDNSKKDNPTYTETRDLKSNSGTKKSAKKDAKIESKKCIATDEDSKDILMKQVKSSGCPKKNRQKNTEVSCYEEEDKENIESKEVKPRSKPKKKTEVKPLEDIIQRSKCEMKAAVKTTETVDEIINDESKTKGRGTERSSRRTKGKESFVDSPDDIFFKSKFDKAKDVKIETGDLKNTVVDDMKNVVKPKGRRKAAHKRSSSDDEAVTKDLKAVKGIKLVTEEFNNTLTKDVEIGSVQRRGRRQRAVVKYFSDDEVENESIKAADVKLYTQELKDTENTMTLTHDAEKKGVKSRGRRQKIIHKKFSSSNETETDATMNTTTAESLKFRTEGPQNTVTCDIQMKSVKSKARRQRANHKKSSDDEAELNDTKMSVTAAEGIKLDTGGFESVIIHGIKKKTVKSKGRQRAILKKSPSDAETELDDTKMSVKAVNGGKIDTAQLESTIADDTENKSIKSKGRKGRAIHKKIPTDYETEMNDIKMSVAAAQDVKSHTEEFECSVAHDSGKKSVKSKGRKQRAVQKKLPIDDETKMNDTKVSVAAAQDVNSCTEELECSVAHDIKKTAVKSKGGRRATRTKFSSDDGTETQDAKIITAVKSENDETKVTGRKGKGKSEENEEPHVASRGRRCKSKAIEAMKAMLDDSYS